MEIIVKNGQVWFFINLIKNYKHVILQEFSLKLFHSANDIESKSGGGPLVLEAGLFPAVPRRSTFNDMSRAEFKSTGKNTRRGHKSPSDTEIKKKRSVTEQ